MSQPPRLAIVAAAGRGTRFVAALPKVLAEVGGRPAVRRVLDAVEAGLRPTRTLIVVGHAAEQVRAVVAGPRRQCVEQTEPRGTGHALQLAIAACADLPEAEVYFFCGDKPLLTAATVARFRERFAAGAAAMLFLTSLLPADEATLLTNRQGRVVTIDTPAGPRVQAILERSVIDALTEPLALDGLVLDREALLRVREVNASTYAWRLSQLRSLLPRLRDDNPQGELLVTDLVAAYLAAGLTVGTFRLSNPAEARGIDTVDQWREMQAT